MIFFKKLLLFSLVLYAVYFFLKPYIPPGIGFDYMHYLFLFFILLMTLFNYFLFGFRENESKNIVMRYLAATTIKFLICITIIVVFIFSARSIAVAFTAHFLILYLLYTAFEVVILYRNIRLMK